MSESSGPGDGSQVVIGNLECWEDLYRLQGFQRPLTAEAMKKGGPVKPYAMPAKAGKRHCGIAECQTPHLRGYVIQVGDVLSNVGHQCASKYFGTTLWKAHIKQLRRNQEAQAAKAALEQARSKARTLLEQANVCPDGYLEVANLLSLFDTLPAGLRGELRERARPGTPLADITHQRAPNAAEIKQAKFHQQPVPHVVEVKVGNISGLKAVAENSRADVVSKRMSRQKDELLALINNESATTEELHRATRLVTTSVELLSRAIERAGTFFSEQNAREIAKLPNGMKFRDIFVGHAH